MLFLFSQNPSNKMIFYGKNTKTLGTEAIPVTCPSCGGQNTTQMTIFQNYVHIYWIPLAPTGVEAVTDCSHCRLALRDGQFTPTLREEYVAMRTRLSRPIWAFSGIIIICAIALISIIVSVVNSRRTASLLDNPKKGDVYEVKLTFNSYTLYRIIDVVGDSIVYFQVNEYETNQPDGLKDLKGKYANDYIPDTIGFSIKDFKALYDEGKILGVDRR